MKVYNALHRTSLKKTKKNKTLMIQKFYKH